jgi:hypothetical protein
MTRSADIFKSHEEAPAGAPGAEAPNSAPTETSADAPRRTNFPWFPPRAIPVLLALAVILRWIFSAMHQLVPDEAYYWVWSRHLALSYLDHPPMVAYIIRLGTAVLGQTEIGIRWPAAILAMGSIAILTGATQRLLGDARATIFVAIALLASPMVQVMGSIITPDTPALFFQSAAVACALAIFSPAKPAEKNIAPENLSLSRAKLWPLFGLFIGLAMLSKYPSALVAIAITLALLSTREGRRHFLTPWIWLGAAISIAVFSPVLLWNARHQWVSILFQLNHGLGSNDSPMILNLLTYLGGQLALFTPILFVMVVMVLTIFALRREPDTSTDTATRILLFTGAFPLLFFAWSSRHRPAEGNWSYFAYMPGTILLAKYLSQNWNGRRVGWAKAGVIVALVMTIGMQLPEVVWSINPKIPSPQWDRLFGWRELAADVDQSRGNSPVYAEDYEYASEMSFYMKGQPETYMLNWWHRPTAYDYFPGRPDIDQLDRFLIVKKITRDGPLPAGAKLQQGFTADRAIVDPGDKQFNHSVRQSEIIVATKPTENDAK